MKKAILASLVVFVIALILGMYVMGGFYQQTELSKSCTVSVGGFLSVMIFIYLDNS